MDNSKTMPASDEAIIQAVHDAYSSKAKSGADSSYAERVASVFGYTPEELKSIPAESHMGLSCGNPVAAASIREGEKVLDLGSGGGIDILLAASKVGPNGQAIGLDMSPEMINRARKNAQNRNLYPPHVAFVETRLTDPLPITSESIDCVLSNCVINLLPPSGKGDVLKEVYRVLKPGGRVFLDDIIAKKPLPEMILKDLSSYVGCISGAIQLEQYKALLINAGLQDIIFADTQEPTKPTPDFDANEWVASYQIYALKPNSTQHDSPRATTIADQPNPLLNWWDAYPKPTSTDSLPRISIEDVAAVMRNPDIRAMQDYAIIDVRRNDHAGGHVRGSAQHPAQSFYDSLPAFHAKYKHTGKVIFYCGSSNGRGPRCAGWYQDYLNGQAQIEGTTNSQAYVLQGGIKAWLAEFGGDEELVDAD